MANQTDLIFRVILSLSFFLLVGNHFLPRRLVYKLMFPLAHLILTLLSKFWSSFNSYSIAVGERI